MATLADEAARPSLPAGARRRFTLASLAAAGLVVAGAIVMLQTKPGDRLSVAVDDAGSLATALLAMAGCAAAVRRHHGHLRAAWVLLALGSLSWAAGEGLWGWMQLVQGNANPFPSVADAAYLGGIPLAAAGILLLRPASESLRSRLRALVDGAIVVIALLSISWITVLGAVWSAGGDSALSLGLSIAYPGGDILLMSMLVFLVMQIPRGGRVPVLLLVAGVGTLAVSDSGFAYMSAANIYGASNVLDVGYWVGYLLLALAGVYAAISPIPAARAPAASARTSLVLPYAPAMAALGLALWAEFDHGLDPFLLTCLATLIVAVLLRQFLALSDNLLLMRSLAHREHQLRHQADHDPLTGLANRACLRRVIDARLDPGRQQTCALLFIDVDDLKYINDQFGHAGGDTVLRAVADRLTETVRDADLAARFGGDEFAIFLPDLTDATQGRDVAERIIASMASPLAVLGGRAVEVSLSIGVATSSGDARLNTEELLGRADAAMYAAKSACKGIAVEWTPLLGGTAHHAGWKSDLERALAGHQFALHYQPIVDSASRRVVSVEALLRWQHPREGLLLPHAFLDDLEATGLIVQVGEWVLQTACREIGSLSRRLGIELDVHVNVSARQVTRPDFPHVVRRALDESQLIAHHLVIELTETSLVDSERAVVAARLRAVKRLGCRVALDDFGTGYSSLTHLREFPIDMIKVDRSFISDLSLDAATPSLAGALVSLGASSGKEVVAEGVETEEQVRALAALHCTLCQGFYFSPAVELRQLAKMLPAAVTEPEAPRTRAIRVGVHPAAETT